MGIPLAPIVANLYMEHSEHQTWSSAIKKPTHCYRYVTYTFVVWAHGKDELQEFLKHLNNIHPIIKFAMKVEQNKTLLFLDVLVSRRPDGSLGHSVHRKSTHTELYLDAKSKHHPAQKQAVLSILVWHARMLCDTENLGGEIHHLKRICQQNGNNKNNIRRALHPKQKPKLTDKKPTSIAMLPYKKSHY
jgi:hypothetical protein